MRRGIAVGVGAVAVAAVLVIVGAMPGTVDIGSGNLAEHGHSPGPLLTFGA